MKLWSNIHTYLRESSHKKYSKIIHTGLDAAVLEIKKRRQDTRLFTEVKQFLNSDIPPHFENREPIFYMSRYIATPDYETLQFIDAVKKYNLPIIIGEDTTDIFTSHSELKRNLVKMPIVTGTAKDGTGIVEYLSLADFNTEQGKQLRDVRTAMGLSLPTIHRTLVRNMLPSNISIVDESAWVDRHSRGKLVSLYESLLSLLIVHGIMLEYYELKETSFISSVVYPAYVATHKRFGLTPLIAPMHPKPPKKHVHVNSYPASVKKYLPVLLRSQVDQPGSSQTTHAA